MTYPSRPESAVDRMRRADKKLTETMHWVVYESDGRSEHSAPPSFVKRENKKRARKELLFWILFGCAVLLGVWAVTR